MKHLIFDFDGVLASTFNFHLEKYNELYNLGLTAQELRDIHNGNFYSHKLDKLKSVDYSEYANFVAKDEGLLPLDPEAKNVLQKQHQYGKNHLVTSGWKVQVFPFLKHHDILKFFTHCLFAEDGTSKSDKLSFILEKESARPEECMFVTDTLGDILEAHEVSVPTVGVTFGFHSEETLKKGSPQHIVNSWEEVEEVIFH